MAVRYEHSLTSKRLQGTRAFEGIVRRLTAGKPVHPVCYIVIQRSCQMFIFIGWGRLVGNNMDFEIGKQRHRGYCCMARRSQLVRPSQTSAACHRWD